MFLRVLHLSDICTRTGNRLLTGSWHNYHLVQSNYHWPNIIQPSTANWITWDVALAAVFNLGRYQTLPYKLGIFVSNQTNGWFYAPVEQALWFKTDSKWTHHSTIPSQYQKQSFNGQGERSEAPEYILQCAMVQTQGVKVILTRSGPIEQITDNLQTQPFHCMWHWEVTFVSNLQQLLDDILAGEGYAVSDSSFQLGKGAATWIVEG